MKKLPSMVLEEEFVRLQEEILRFQLVLEKELASVSDDNTAVNVAEITFLTKSGKRYMQFESFTVVCFLISFLHPNCCNHQDNEKLKLPQ